MISTRQIHGIEQEISFCKGKLAISAESANSEPATSSTSVGAVKGANSPLTFENSGQVSNIQEILVQVLSRMRDLDDKVLRMEKSVRNLPTESANSDFSVYLRRLDEIESELYFAMQRFEDLEQESHDFALLHDKFDSLQKTVDGIRENSAKLPPPSVSPLEQAINKFAQPRLGAGILPPPGS